MPHKRIIRNLRRLLTDIADKPQEREKHIENLLLILPRGSADPLKAIRPKPEKKEGVVVEEEDEEDEFDDTIHFVEDVSAERYRTEEEDYEDDKE